MLLFIDEQKMTITTHSKIYVMHLTLSLVKINFVTFVTRLTLRHMKEERCGCRLHFNSEST